mmetsp:Transcript_10874/g.32178  ORF Transcript_10874/g.32178 Transcript_10874/m.32178 type:complete len:331 (+) Transcript_10874:113-1105(+)
MPSLDKSLEEEHLLPKSGARCRISNGQSDLAVVLTHPWGPLGGNLHNNVVVAASLFFRRLGVTTLRLNFRGSQISRGYKEVNQVVEAADFLLGGGHLRGEDGGDGSAEAGSKNGDNDEEEVDFAVTEAEESVSAGIRRKRDHGSGAGELEKARRRFRRKKCAPSSILLVGYSYGSLIAASASADIDRCIGFVSIAPPVSVKHWLLLFNAGYHVQRSMTKRGLPRLMVMGSSDDFTSPKHFHEFVRSFPDTTTGAELKGVNHFFGGRERDLMNVIGTWLLETYASVIEGDLKRLGSVDFFSYTSPSVLDEKLEDTEGKEGQNPSSNVCACI